MLLVSSLLLGLIEIRSVWLFDCDKFKNLLIRPIVRRSTHFELLHDADEIFNKQMRLMIGLGECISWN